MDNSMEKDKTESSSPSRRLKRHLTVGNIWLYILSLIKKQKRLYAYTLNEEIENKFQFKPSKVMIYLVLYRLEAEKMIGSKFEERRKYYTLTEKGEETLRLAKEYLKLLSERL